MPVISLVLAAASFVAPQEAADQDPPAWGHSSHGPAFDAGPRQRPWRIDGIGHAPFPVTSEHPEVQQWFDQGNALMHSFWDFEAERAFRWCVTLDPDCATAYWALARATFYAPERALEFLRLARDKKHHVSEREQRYIEAYSSLYLPGLERPEPVEFGAFLTSSELGKELDRLIVDFPDDVEAKLLYVNNSYEVGPFDENTWLREAVLQDVLAVRPEHPGAVHYRIHNWDDLELGHFALDSCELYGRIAPSIGHANHMPGHVYTKLGMWHEGAIWLDSATRVEKAYLEQRMVVPHQAWNYSHNRNFLAHAQSMLGLPSSALEGAYDLLNAPIDPDENSTEANGSTFREGLSALRRTLLRFERWDDVLAPGRVPWPDTAQDRMWRAYANALAHLGRGDLEEAEREGLALIAAGEELEPEDEELTDEEAIARSPQRLLDIMLSEVEGRSWLARGDTVRGLAALTRAADLELAMRAVDNDPPAYPRCVYNVLGEAYLDLGSARPAIGAFERALEVLPGNGFSWAGLARAHHALGDLDRARHAYARMLHVWSGAEPGIRQLEAARALGLEAQPVDDSPRPERDYPNGTLARLGPNLWEPYAAPALDVRNAAGDPVTLAEYRGRNVLLVFYLSDECVHCMEQLRALGDRIDELEERDTVVLAVSADAPEANAASEVASLPFTVLSDTRDHANAIRYKSYDEFEEIELHSTQLVDRQGRLRWVRRGGEPFSDVDFLIGEIDRVEALDESGRLDVAASAR